MIKSARILTLFSFFTVLISLCGCFGMRDSKSGVAMRDKKQMTSDVPLIRFSQTPNLDGNLDGACWENAQFINFDGEKALSDKVDIAIVDNSKKKELGKGSGDNQFALGYTDKGLYIAVRCLVPDTSALVANCEVPDGLFEWFRKDDMVEVLLDPGCTGHYYYWFRVNPKAMRTDLCNTSGLDRSWNGDWDIATKLTKDTWTCEFFFPFAGFNRMPFTAECGLNIARFSPKGNKRVTFGGEYRKPKTWPVVRLNDIGKALNSPSLACDNIQINDINKKGKGDISAIIKNLTNSSITIYPEFRIMRPTLARGYFPQANGPRTTFKVSSVTIKSQGKTRVSAKIDINPDESLLPTLVLKDAKGETLFVAPDKGLRLNHIIGGAGPEFSYYSKESKARFAFKLPSVLKEDVLKLSIESGVKIHFNADIKSPPADCVVSYPISVVPMGNSTLRAELSRSGKIVASRSFPVLRLEPNKNGNEVKVNRWSASIVVEGKPFVPVGNSPSVTHHGLSHGQTMSAAMKTNNFNCMHLWGGFLKRDAKNKKLPTCELDLPKLQKCFDMAEENDLMVIMNVASLIGNNPASPFTNYKLTDEQRLAKVTQVVNAIKGRSVLLGYEIFDEPGFFAAPEWLERTKDHIKKLDPYHLVSSNNCRGALSVIPFLNATDVVGIDYYPIGKEAASTVAPLTDELVQFAGTRPLKWWIQGYKIFNPRAPTPAEVKAMTYMAIAHGAKSIFYFIGRPAKPLWEVQGECAKELRLLTEAITTEDVFGVDVSPRKSTVYASLRANNARYWVIAVNEEGKAQSVTFSLPKWMKKKSIKVERVFAKGKPVVVNQAKAMISDDFKPFERHVYEIIPKTP